MGTGELSLSPLASRVLLVFLWNLNSAPGGSQATSPHRHEAEQPSLMVSPHKAEYSQGVGERGMGHARGVAEAPMSSNAISYPRSELCEGLPNVMGRVQSLYH